MKQKNSKLNAILFLALAFSFCQTTLLNAETIILQDADYVINGAPAGATQTVSLRFGIWNSVAQTFTQSGSGDFHLGYATMAGDEMQITLNQTDNTLIGATQQLALAVFTNGSANAGPLDYSLLNAPYRAILVNSAWVAGTFANNTDERFFDLDGNTTAVIGGYTYGGGTQTISLVPEPNTTALILTGISSMLFSRRRKQKIA